MYQYSCAYYVDTTTRVVHRMVIARDADDARRRLRIIDPRYLATAKSPRRGKAILEVEAK